MLKMTKNRRKTVGLPPGSLIHVGKKRTAKPKITIFDYDEKDYQEKTVETIEECFPYKDTSTVTWINIDGVHHVDLIEKIGEHFNIHPLVQEDILNTAQRPKIEDFDDYLFVVLKMLCYDEKKKEVTAEQVSLILGSNVVLSFQEQEGDTFDAIRERIRKSKGRLRKNKADYLAYALIDTIVDNYFLILEKIGEKIEDIEDELVEDPAPETLQTIQNLKRDMIYLRKSVWPLREVVSGLERTESSLILKSTRVYLRDVYDHTIQVIDTIETFRDMVSGMLDIYLSSVSNKMNEVMKVLTIFAAIFIPLTFIAGVYGMNFQYMPELGWQWSYPLVWGAFIVVGLSLLLYFNKKGWI